MKETPRHSRVLAIHPGALGDCILLGRLLAACYGKQGVTFVGHSQPSRLLAGLGAVEYAVDFDGLPMHELFSDPSPAEAQLPARLGTCDRLISLYAEEHALAREKLIRACQAQEATFLPIRPPANFPGHLTELWLEKLDLPGGKESLSRQVWTVPPSWRETGQKRLEQAGWNGSKPYLVLHPGAGGKDKRHPAAWFADLAEALKNQLAFQPVFVLGPVEREKFSRQERDVIGRFPLVSCPTAEEFAGLLAGAKAMVGHDSGPAHLSASLGIATICLFRTTSPVHFAPLGKEVLIFQTEKSGQALMERILEKLC